MEIEGMSEPWLIEKIFDVEAGWVYSQSLVPVQESRSPGGNPTRVVTVDGIEITVFQIREWDEAIQDATASPERLVARVKFENVKLLKPDSLLQNNYGMQSLPSFAVDERDDAIALQAAFPVSADFPVDLARKQLLVCLALLSQEANRVLKAWNTPSGKATPEDSDGWELAGNVARVAGIFLRAFVDG